LGAIVEQCEWLFARAPATRSERPTGATLDLQKDVITIVGRVLNLGARSASFDTATPLLGSVTELDSMAVASIITSLEEHFGFAIDDDEIDGSTFETIGSLVTFVRAKCMA
jgi:acyl carrier protein